MTKEQRKYLNREILALIAEDYTNTEIGIELEMSKRTVEGVRKRLIKSFGVKGTAGLIVKAMREGIIE